MGRGGKGRRRGEKIERQRIEEGRKGMKDCKTLRNYEIGDRETAALGKGRPGRPGTSLMPDFK